jgi:hypothetical protein
MKKKGTKPPAITVDIPPYGRMRILGEDNDGALSTFRKDWQKLWPTVKRKLKGMLREYNESFDTPIRLTQQKWLGLGCKLEPDVFMGDQADLYLRIQFEEPADWEDAFPTWDFFINGTSVVHCQPVF